MKHHSGVLAEGPARLAYADAQADAPLFAADLQSLDQLPDGQDLLLLAEPYRTIHRGGRVALEVLLPLDRQSARMVQLPVWVDCERMDNAQAEQLIKRVENVPFVVRKYSEALYTRLSALPLPRSGMS